MTSEPLALLRNMDLALVVVALVVFLVAGLPLLGWVTGAGVWLIWRSIGAWADRRASASTDPRAVVSIEAGSMVGRGWLLGLTLILAGVAGDRDIGLSAAVLAVVLFTVFFTMKLVLRPLSTPAPRGSGVAPR